MSQAIAFGLDLALKSTVLLSLAILTHALLGRRRALARSAIWNACLAALLVLPPVVGLSPRLRVGGLGRLDGDRIARALADDRPDDVHLSQEVIVLRAARSGSGREDFRGPHRVDPGAGEDVPQADGPRAAGHVTLEASRPSIPPNGPSGVLSIGWVGLAVLVYALGGAVLAVRLLGSLAAVARLRRRSVAVDTPIWREGLERWRAWLGIARPIALGRSDHVTVPVAIGWLRPSVLMPGSLAGTSDPRLVDAVLLHELCHIRRGDYAWNIVWKLAQVAYWPQPLIWLAGPLIRGVRERACDELCVHALGGAQGYRAALVTIAAGLVGPRPARGLAMSLGLAMARSPRLARRLDQIERTGGRASCRLGRRERWTIIAVVVAIAALLGALEGGRGPSRAGVVAQATKAGPGPDEPAQPASPAPRPVPDAVELTILDARTDKPLAGATVLNWIDFRKDDLTTNDQGRVRVPRSTGLFRERVSVDVWKDGYVQQRFGWGQNHEDGAIPERFTIRLLPGEVTYGGLVKDERGKPIPGALVEIWGYLKEKKEPHELCYMVRSTTDAQGRWRNSSLREMTFIYIYLLHPDFLIDGGRHPRTFGSPSDRDKPPSPNLDRLRKQTDVQVMGRGVDLRGRVVDDQGRPIVDVEVGWVEDEQQFHSDLTRTRTDDQGLFHFAHARPGRLAVLAKARGRSPGLATVKAGPGAEPVELRLGPGRVLQGRVVDLNDKPIEGAFVNIDTWRGYRCLGVYLLSDRDGRFRWDDAPPDDLKLNVDRTGYQGVHWRDVPAASKDVVFTLTPSLRISGRVQDGITGKAPGGLVEIERGAVDPQSGEVARWVHDDRMSVHQGYISADVDASNPTSFKLRITAAGYEPFVSRTIRSDEGFVKLDASLQKLATTRASGPSGVVRAPDRSPLAGAQVVMSTVESRGAQRRGRWVSIAQGRVVNADQHMIVTTGPDGRFTFPPAEEPYEVLAFTDAYYALATKAELEAGHELKTQPWGRIEGQLLIGSKPAAGSYVQALRAGTRSSAEPGFGVSDKVQTDAEGRFAFRQVFAGNILLFYGLEKGGKQVWSRGNRIVAVESGQTTRVTLGGHGRPVIGRIAPPPDFGRPLDFSEWITVRIESNKPWSYFPPEVLRSDDVLQGMFQAGQTPGQIAYQGQYVQMTVAMAEDGSFRVEDVPAGTYRLTNGFARRVGSELTSASGRGIASLEHFFTVPEMPGGRSDEPLDLGTIRLSLRPSKPLSDGESPLPSRSPRSTASR
jgi:protocatechuate 3,4-dioxygenase beta subunit